MEGYWNQCAESGASDHAHRCVRIGTSWTRKALSAVRRYAEHRDLAFFMYEKHLASTYFAAHYRAKDFGVTADVMKRTSQLTAGYWEITQDALADVVRVMMRRCYDENG